MATCPAAQRNDDAVKELTTCCKANVNAYPLLVDKKNAYEKWGSRLMVKLGNYWDACEMFWTHLLSYVIRK